MASSTKRRRRRRFYNRLVNASERHLQLLTESIAAVNSTLDLEEVLSLVARKVAEALDTEACFVYLYDEGADELVLRATQGTSVEAMTRRPRMRPGEGITGTAAAERMPIAIPPERTSTHASRASRTSRRTSTSRSSPSRSSRGRSSPAH